MLKNLVLLCLALFMGLASAQLSEAAQNNLVNLANTELQRQLVNGSDAKSANKSLVAQTSLRKIVQSGQILNLLNTPSQLASKICEFVQKNEERVTDDASIETILLRAEALTLFKCPESQFSVSVREDVTRVLENPTSSVVTVNDYYQAFMIHKRAKDFGVKSTSQNFINTLNKVMGDDFISQFNAETFSWKVDKSEAKGLTLNTIRLIELFANAASDSKSNVSGKALKKVEQALGSILAHASSTSQDDTDENQTWFVAPKAAFSQDGMDLTQINLHVLNILNMSSKLIKNKKVNFDSEHFSLFRNYFSNKANAALTTATASYALTGLTQFTDQVLLQNINQPHLSPLSKNNKLSFNVVDLYGKPSTAKSIKKASYYQIDDPETVTSCESSTKLINGGKTIEIEFSDLVDMKWTSYQVQFTIETASNVSHVTKSFQIKPKIFEEAAVSVTQNGSWESPTEFQHDGRYPVVFEPVNTDSKPVLHIQIDAQFAGDAEKQDRPSTVYALLQKTDQIPYSIHADYIEAIKRYQIDASLQYLIQDKINGDYNLKIVVEDPRAINSYTKDLGTLQVNFNEGSNDANNSGLRDDYNLFPIITNYFPPEEVEKGALIPLVFSGIIVAMFLVFFTSIFSTEANLQNLSFWGLLFTLNYAGILSIIIAFWVKVNLVNTLWILLAAAPVTLFLMNKGISPESCVVQGFGKSTGPKKTQ